MGSKGVQRQPHQPLGFLHLAATLLFPQISFWVRLGAPHVRSLGGKNRCTFTVKCIDSMACCRCSTNNEACCVRVWPLFFSGSPRLSSMMIRSIARSLQSRVLVNVIVFWSISQLECIFHFFKYSSPQQPLFFFLFFSPTWKRKSDQQKTAWPRHTKTFISQKKNGVIPTNLGEGAWSLARKRCSTYGWPENGVVP